MSASRGGRSPRSSPRTRRSRSPKPGRRNPRKWRPRPSRSSRSPGNLALRKVHTRRSYLILLGLIVVAVIGAGFLAIPGSPVHRKTTLGLDLQGGLEIVLKAQAPKGQKVTQDGLARSVDRIRARIDKLGVSEPDVRKQDPDQIVVQLPGVHDPERAAAIIGKTAQLELYDLEKNLTGPSVVAQGIARYPRALTSPYALLAGQQLKAKTGSPTAFYLFNPKKKEVGAPADTRDQLLRSALPPRYHGKLPKGWKDFAVPHD